MSSISFLEENKPDEESFVKLRRRKISSVPFSLFQISCSTLLQCENQLLNSMNLNMKMVNPETRSVTLQAVKQNQLLLLMSDKT